MRRSIGISLAALIIFACALGWGAAHSGWAADHGSVRGGNPDRCCSHVRSTRTSLVGKAARYNRVGKRTASGEILDTVTPTAAHRSLPLASHAKVTNLDNGRSVVVKINDRGPYARGRILDLSPRAADALDVKRAGIAAVVVEPLVN
ncbi:MAG TPA: septal ring lytic transglycosylase RlpA family protein [Stellaceae bacterium]|nr:septal ring lytic transglycosylase RlpA family protein [Stellaceae bacterium]